MSEQVLTDDEKSALLDGMSSGAVSVQAGDRQKYADVKEFAIGPRSRIVTDSFPRLQLLDQQFAERMSRRAEQLLNCEAEITGNTPSFWPFSEFREQIPDPSLLCEFEAAPLSGSGLIYLESGLITHLVDSFFGGGCQETVRQKQSSFTPGEISVANIFVTEILSTVADIWESLIEFTPSLTRTRLGTDLVDGVDSSDLVITTRYDMSFRNVKGTFYVAWPTLMVAPLVPVLEGQKRERDPIEDARWEKALRSSVSNTVVNIATWVGSARHSLGDLVGLTPGDVIDIENPRKATIYTKKVPILSGRFGVHDGRNAIETVEWLEPCNSIAQ